MNVYDALRQLEKSIKESEEYKKYQDLKNTIAANEDSSQALKEVRKKQMEAQSYLMMGQEIPEEKMKELETVNELIASHPTLNDFLQSEYMLGKIFEDISKSMGETFNFWVPEGVENPEEENN